jgi:uncharacterized protein (DUF2336 family)
LEAAIVHNAFRNLGLDRLASRDGVDVRQTALRVATDLFCQIKNPAPADIKRYAHLASGLLECSGAETRLEVATRLARAPFAPLELLQRLRRDSDVLVASAILAISPVLPVEDINSFLLECGPAEAAAVARRTDLEPHAVRLLAAHPHPIIAEALAENSSCRLDGSALTSLINRGKQYPVVAQILLARGDIAPLKLAPLYRVATVEMRRRLRAALAETSPRGSRTAFNVPAEDLTAAIGLHDHGAFNLALTEALRTDPRQMDVILEDCEGDLLMLALAAAGLSRPVATQALLLFAPEAVRISVSRIFAAADLHDETPRWVANLLIDEVFGRRRPARAAHEPHMHDSGVPQRSGAASKPLNVAQRDALAARK